MAKIQISVDDDLLKRVDDFSEKVYMSRSGLFSLAVNDYINSREFIFYCRDLAVSLKKIADSDKVSQEDLEEFKTMVGHLEYLAGSVKTP